MRKLLTHEFAFLLVRLAAKLDVHYTLELAKALTRAAKANDATIQIEVARPLAERLGDWSEPVQIQFHDTEHGWQMYVRSCEQAISEQIRAIALRQ